MYWIKHEEECIRLNKMSEGEVRRHFISANTQPSEFVLSNIKNFIVSTKLSWFGLSYCGTQWLLLVNFAQIVFRTTIGSPYYSLEIIDMVISCLKVGASEPLSIETIHMKIKFELSCRQEESLQYVLLCCQDG